MRCAGCDRDGGWQKCFAGVNACTSCRHHDWLSHSALALHAQLVPREDIDDSRRARQGLTGSTDALPQARRRLSRKAEILLELLAAGDGVEARMKTHSAEVDDLMLQLLQRRIEAAERCARPSMRSGDTLTIPYQTRPPLPAQLAPHPPCRMRPPLVQSTIRPGSRGDSV